MVCSVFKTYHVSPSSPIHFFSNFLIFFFRSIKTFFKTNPIIEVNKTLYKELEKLIGNRINQETIYPELVTINKVYEDNQHVDCTNETDTSFRYIPVIGTPVKNNTGLMFTLADGTFIIITK